MPPQSETRYVKFLQGTGTAALGKIPAGRIMILPTDQADRFIAVGHAEVTTKAAYEKQQAQRLQEAQERSRAGDFQRLNERAGTDRPLDDGPESTSDLADAQGNPLPDDPALRAILKARHAVGATPESSKPEAPDPHTAGTLTGVKPLTDKRPTAEQVGNAPEPDDDEPPPRTRRK